MDEKKNATKKERGCIFIFMIIITTFLVVGIFFIVAGKIFGPTYRQFIFFSILGAAVVFFLIRELVAQDKKKIP